jgi:hypothetical protein
MKARGTAGSVEVETRLTPLGREDLQYSRYSTVGYERRFDLASAPADFIRCRQSTCQCFRWTPTRYVVVNHLWPHLGSSGGETVTSCGASFVQSFLRESRWVVRRERCKRLGLAGSGSTAPPSRLLATARLR